MCRPSLRRATNTSGAMEAVTLPSVATRVTFLRAAPVAFRRPTVPCEAAPGPTSSGASARLTPSADSLHVCVSLHTFTCDAARIRPGRGATLAKEGPWLCRASDVPQSARRRRAAEHQAAPPPSPTALDLVTFHGTRGTCAALASLLHAEGVPGGTVPSLQPGRRSRLATKVTANPALDAEEEA